jgi:hypothetical protein
VKIHNVFAAAAFDVVVDVDVVVVDTVVVVVIVAGVPVADVAVDEKIGIVVELIGTDPHHAA